MNLGPAVLVPLGAPGNVRGVLTAGRDRVPCRWRRPRPTCSLTFATQAGIALELAEHRRQAERVAVFEDRDRIARDLHDLVIQRLYATGMSLQGTISLIGSPEAAQRVSAAVDALDETIREIRSSIFALQTRRGHQASWPAGADSARRRRDDRRARLRAVAAAGRQAGRRRAGRCRRAAAHACCARRSPTPPGTRTPARSTCRCEPPPTCR